MLEAQEDAVLDKKEDNEVDEEEGEEDAEEQDAIAAPDPVCLCF